MVAKKTRKPVTKRKVASKPRAKKGSSFLGLSYPKNTNTVSKKSFLGLKYPKRTDVV
jgi:hypothetical protein